MLWFFVINLNFSVLQPSAYYLFLWFLFMLYADLAFHLLILLLTKYLTVYVGRKWCMLAFHFFSCSYKVRTLEMQVHLHVGNNSWSIEHAYTINGIVTNPKTSPVIMYIHAFIINQVWPSCLIDLQCYLIMMCKGGTNMQHVQAWEEQR